MTDAEEMSDVYTLQRLCVNRRAFEVLLGALQTLTFREREVLALVAGVHPYVEHIDAGCRSGADHLFDSCPADPPPNFDNPRAITIERVAELLGGSEDDAKRHLSKACRNLLKPMRARLIEQLYPPGTFILSLPDGQSFRAFRT